MTTQGFEHLYLETHDWGKSVAFWKALGFEVDFETDHHSGQLVAPNGTRIFLAVRTFAERLMAAEVEVLCNAGYGEVSEERTNSRNGYRPRPLDTRVGSIELAIPKLREGSYYRGWLLEPRRRAERALVAVVADATSGALAPVESRAWCRPWASSTSRRAR